MTNAELARRLAQMDWSGCSLQHQLAVAAAVTTLRAEAGLCERRGPLPGNVIDLSEVFRREQRGDCGETKNLDVESPAALSIGSNVVALRPSTCQRTVALTRLDGTPFAQRSFQPGLASAPWDWIVETVSDELNVAPTSVGCVDPDLVTVDGLPVYCVDFPF